MGGVRAPGRGDPDSPHRLRRRGHARRRGRLRAHAVRGVEVDGHVHRAARGDRHGGAGGMSAPWSVYGRTEYAEPLSEQGVLRDVAADEVAERAVARFGRGWVELVAFP